MPPDDVETARLVLRRVRDDDVDDLVALHGDVRVMRFIDDGRPVPADVVRTRDLAWLRRDHGPGRGYRVARTRDGAFVGWFGLAPAHDAGPGEEDVLELGYRLSPARWGEGLATEGARALVAHAFTVAGASRVWGTTMVANTGSRRVLEAAGLRHVRTFHADWPHPVPGSELGDVDLALDAASWRAARAAAGR